MRQTEPQWGYAGERPVYLYEEQLRDADRFDRDADWWAVALARVIANAMGISLAPVLPDDAAGAVIVTGDDDQAALEKYAEQLALLDNTPVTYFLHPQTRHTRESVRVMLGKPWIDLGLHPDALDAPSRYRELLLEQGERIADLIGHRPLSVRNHGFLNDGYWGHLPAWLEYGIRISSNLPGVDGRVLNGSLLPARLVYGQSLTRHWSLLTAIGDGMRFALNSTDAQAGRRILDLADAVRASGVPGIIVLNLHPENVLETREMHRAAIEVIRSGFCAWTMRECLEWFERRDAGAPTPGTGDFLGPIRKIWRRLSVIGS